MQASLVVGAWFAVAALRAGSGDFSVYIGGQDAFAARTMLADGAGNLYVSSSPYIRDKLIKLDAQGNILQRWTDCAPVMSVDRQGNPWFLCGDILTKRDPDGTDLLRIQLPALPASIAAFALDAQQNIYLTGETQVGAAGFPTTVGAYMQRPLPAAYPYTSYGFVTKIAANSGDIVWSTIFGGSSPSCTIASSACISQCCFSSAASIGVDDAGDAVVAGGTNTSNFPLTQGALKGDGGSFIVKFNPSGSALLYSFRIGHDTSLPGYSPRVTSDSIMATVVRDDGSVYLAGATNATDLPVTPGAYQPEYSGVITQNLITPSTNGFVMRLSPDGAVALYCTYLGSPGSDAVTAMTVDSEGNAWLTGDTASPTFPNSLGPFPNGPRFLAVMNADGSALLHSMRLPPGIGGARILLSDNGNATLLDSSGIVTRLGLPPASPLLLDVGYDTISAPRLRVAPRTIVRLLGFNLVPDESDAPLSVLWDDTPSTILDASPAGIRTVTPDDLQDKDTVLMRVFHGESEIASTRIAATSIDPELYPTIWNPDGSANSFENPAPDGGIISVFGTGFGLSLSNVGCFSHVADASLVYAGPDNAPGIFRFDIRIVLRTHPLPFSDLIVEVDSPDFSGFHLRVRVQ